MDASLLYEVPKKEGNERSEGSYHEEQKACDKGYLPDLRYQNVPNRKRLIN
jgi:hypothetical protein